MKEKEKNLTAFRNYTNKQPQSVSLQKITEAIREDEKLKTLTLAYRKTKKKTIKMECPLFCVAATLKDGKALANVTHLTGLSLVDLDHIDTEELSQLKLRIKADPHTLLCYTTISGSGLRIIFRYEMPTESTHTPDTPMSDALLRTNKIFYQKAFNCGNTYYEELTGAGADRQCKNLTRLSGLAHDPDAYLNTEAQPFTLTQINELHTRQLSEKRELKTAVRIQRYFTTTIAPHLEAEGIRYASGSHNQYVMRTGYMLAKKRYPKEEAIQWAINTFPEYEDTEQVINSYYANAYTEQNPYSRRHNATTASDPMQRFATVGEIKQFLKENAQLRYNEVTHRVEIHTHNRWQPMNDREMFSLWAQMSDNTRVRITDFTALIRSDFTEAYNPFRHYIEQLPQWQPGDTDHIQQLAETVSVSGDHKWWHQCLEKWLTAMVAGWLKEDVVNNVMLVFIGQQGSYKTTWFNHLLPPELKHYFYTKTNNKRMTKDELLSLTCYALVCCEELDTMTDAELNQLKAVITMQSIDERAPYARFQEHREHIASFCGTGNNPRFLSDTTGNRRWLPFEVKEIKSPREQPFNHPGIYAQAFYLLNSGYKYWFEKEDMQRQATHNQRFETPNMERELVELYFRKPTEGETGIFMTATRALQIIGYGITQKMSASSVGRALGDLGFKKARIHNARGYILIQRTAEEIKQYQQRLAINAEDDNEEPPTPPTPPTPEDEPTTPTEATTPPEPAATPIDDTTPSNPAEKPEDNPAEKPKSEKKNTSKTDGKQQ